MELAPDVRVREPELEMAPERLEALEERDPEMEMALAMDPLFRTLPET